METHRKKMFSSNTRLKPFNSDPIKVEGQAICAVTFGSNSVPVKWHIIASKYETILTGNSVTALGIIEFNHKQGILASISMIGNDLQGKIQSCLVESSHNFKTIGKLKNYQIKLHINTKVKPVATALRSIPSHLHDQAPRVIQDIINHDIIVDHRINQPAP